MCSRWLTGCLRTREAPTSHRALPEATVPVDSAALRPVCTSRSAVTRLLQPAHLGVHIPVPAVPHTTAHQGWEGQTLGLGIRSPFSSQVLTLTFIHYW